MGLYRKQIGKGICFNAVTDERYKTNRITVNLITTLCEETASANAAAANMLDKSNSKIPDRSDFSIRLGELYGTSVTGVVSKIGNNQIVSLAASFIASKFAFDGENIKLEAAGLLRDCLLSPVMEDGKFPEAAFEIEKNNLIDDIDADLNDKRVYSVNRATSVMFEGEPCSIHKLGTRQTAMALTSDTVTKAYNRLLSEAQIEIMYVGCEDYADLCEYFEKEFSGIKRGNVGGICGAETKIKPETENVTERLSVSQSKMVLGFKTDSEDREAFRLLSAVYGGTPTSKLFMNVREKMSLCYYCASRYDRFTKSLVVECGVENENIEKARAEILNQLEMIRNSEISDDEMLFAKLSIQNALKAAGDSPGALEGWYLSQIFAKTSLSPEQVNELAGAVTKQRVAEAARSLKLDTVYVLTGEEE